jgi:hypothetical protein
MLNSCLLCLDFRIMYTRMNTILLFKKERTKFDVVIRKKWITFKTCICLNSAPIGKFQEFQENLFLETISYKLKILLGERGRGRIIIRGRKKVGQLILMNYYFHIFIFALICCLEVIIYVIVIKRGFS